MYPLGPQHATALFSQFAHPHVYRFFPAEPPASVEALAARYRRIAAGPPSSSERWYNWAVSLRERRAESFGTVELSLLESGRRALLAYVFAPHCWGHGYAGEACAAALAFLRSRTPVREVAASIDTRNTRSIALAERLGFTRAATIEDADYFKGSTSHEYDYRLALVKDEHGEINER